MYVKTTAYQNTQLYSKTEYSTKYNFINIIRFLEIICYSTLVLSIVFNRGFKFQGIKVYFELTLLLLCYISFIIYRMLEQSFANKTIKMIRRMGKEERDNFIRQYGYKFKNGKIKVLSRYYEIEEDI